MHKLLMQTFESPRLRLRPFTIGDANMLLKLMNEPTYIQNIGDRNVRTLEQATQYLSDRFLWSYIRHGFGYLVVERKSDFQCVGICGLLKRDGFEDIDIGYALFPQYSSMGYATEAAGAYLDFSRDVLKLKRIAGFTSPHNVASSRVLEKIGLKFEKNFKFPNENRDTNYFVINF